MTKIIPVLFACGKIESVTIDERKGFHSSLVESVGEMILSGKIKMSHFLKTDSDTRHRAFFISKATIAEVIPWR